MTESNDALRTAIRHLGAGEIDQAIAWYAKADQTGAAGAKLTHDLLVLARGGDPAATHVFGSLMAEGGNSKEAIRWYSESAGAGNPEAMNDLGVVLEQLNDPDGALFWYTRATRAGRSEAMDAVLRVLGEQDAVIAWIGVELEEDNPVARAFLRSLSEPD